MAEGVFPKIAGDALYASEINSFALGTRCFGAGSTIWVLSGTAYQDAGSVVINAGSLTNPAFLSIYTRVQSNYESPAGTILVIQISGISTNYSIGLSGNQSFISLNALIGSPYIGGISGFNEGVYFSADCEGLNALDPLVIKFKLKTGTSAVGSARLFPYVIFGQKTTY